MTSQPDQTLLRSSWCVLLCLTACGDAPMAPLPTESAARVIALSRTHLSGVVGEPVTPEPHVRVVDDKGQPLVFERIHFVVTNGNGIITQADTITDANGEARAQWVLGTKSQAYWLSVHSRSRHTVEFNAEARAGSPARIIDAQQRLEQIGLSGDRIVPPEVQVVDAFGNGVPGVELKAAVTAGGGWIGGDAPLRTSDCCPAGAAALPVWVLGDPGENTVVVALPGIDRMTFTAVALDSTSATWYVTMPQNHDTFGLLQTKLALSASGHFIEDTWASHNGGTDRFGARFAGRYKVISGTLTLTGCSLIFDGQHCFAKTGQVAGDSIVIGSQHYYRRLPQPALPPPFPVVTHAARIYEGVDSPYWSYHASKLASRYVLYDDRTFALQYASARWGVFEYLGVYVEENSVITFDWDGWSTAGAWGATASLRGDSLFVRYNIIMQLTDFEDGLYLRKR